MLVACTHRIAPRSFSRRTHSSPSLTCSLDVQTSDELQVFYTLHDSGLEVAAACMQHSTKMRRKRLGAVPCSGCAWGTSGTITPCATSFRHQLGRRHLVIMLETTTLRCRSIGGSNRYWAIKVLNMESRACHAHGCSMLLGNVPGWAAAVSAPPLSVLLVHLPCPIAIMIGFAYNALNSQNRRICLI